MKPSLATSKRLITFLHCLRLIHINLRPMSMNFFDMSAIPVFATASPRLRHGFGGQTLFLVIERSVDQKLHLSEAANTG